MRARTGRLRQGPAALLYAFAFARPMVTKYQKLSGLNNIHCWSHGSGVSKFKLKLLAGMTSEGCEGRLYPRALPWLVGGRSSTYVSSHSLSSMLV